MLTKTDLTEQLFDESGINKREAKIMIALFFEEIKKASEQSEPVKISAFGNFKHRDKISRPGSDPKTGEAIPVTAMHVVTFSSRQKLEA